METRQGFPRLTFAPAVFALAIALSLSATTAARADGQREEIEAIVRGYLAARPDEIGEIVKGCLVRHPEALREAMIETQLGVDPFLAGFLRRPDSTPLRTIEAVSRVLRGRASKAIAWRDQYALILVTRCPANEPHPSRPERAPRRGQFFQSGERARPT